MLIKFLEHSLFVKITIIISKNILLSQHNFKYFKDRFSIMYSFISFSNMIDDWQIHQKKNQIF